jgi:hypothetical protein
VRVLRCSCGCVPRDSEFVSSILLGVISSRQTSRHWLSSSCNDLLFEGLQAQYCLAVIIGMYSRRYLTPVSSAYITFRAMQPERTDV